MVKMEKSETLDMEYFQQLLLRRFGALRQQKNSTMVKSEEERIELALSRIKWGNYQRCMECAEDIGVEHLMAEPTTLVCLNCSTAKTK